jgi:hypothetical protein
VTAVKGVSLAHKALDATEGKPKPGVGIKRTQNLTSSNMGQPQQ